MILNRKSLLLVSLFKFYLHLCQENDLPKWRMKANEQENIIAESLVFIINNTQTEKIQCSQLAKEKCSFLNTPNLIFLYHILDFLNLYQLVKV